jgi:integral membrane sensor domain MASE1
LQPYPAEQNKTLGTLRGNDQDTQVVRFSNRDGLKHQLIKGAVAVLLLLVYFAAGKLGLRLASVNASVSPIWPPTGIALAALLILGYEFWPIILIGAFLVNITTTGTLPTSISVAFGNTLEALFGAYLVNRFAAGRQAMVHVTSVFKFALLGGLTSTAVSATIGVTSLCLGHLAAWNQFSSVWLTWWLGDSAGTLTWTPFLLLWMTRSDEFRSWRWWLELAAFGACFLLASELVFGPYSPLSAGHYPVEFVFIPLLVWPAFRSGPRGTAAAILLISTATIWRTLHGFGPFVRANENESLLLLQTFTGVVSATSLAVAAVVSERAEKEQRLREAHNAAESLESPRDTVRKSAPIIAPVGLDSVAELGIGIRSERLPRQDCRPGEPRIVHAIASPKPLSPRSRTKTRDITRWSTGDSFGAWAMRYPAPWSPRRIREALASITPR